MLCKKLTPGGCVLALKILLTDTFSVLMILCLGLKDTLQEVLKDTLCKKLTPGGSVLTLKRLQEVLKDTFTRI